MSPIPVEKIAEEVNTSFTLFAKENKFPKEHFVFIDTDVHPVVLSACRKLKILSLSFASLVKDLEIGIQSINRVDHRVSKEVSNSDLSRIRDYTLDHIAIWNKKFDKLIVFPNLEFMSSTVYDLSPAYHSRDVASFRNESGVFAYHTLQLKNKVKEDLENGKVAAWYPIHRGIKRLSTRNETAISTYLARYLKFKGRKVSELVNGAQIVDFLSARMADLHKPTKFSFADSVSEMRQMYVVGSSETPTSCMDSNHRFSITNDARPVDFYSYCPITRGAVIKRGDYVLARTICWHDTHKNQWYYGRIYCNRSSYGDSLLQELKDLGFKKLQHEDSRFTDHYLSSIRDGNEMKDDWSTVDFSVPVHYSSEDGETIFPIPYLDRMPFHSLDITFDYDKQEWKVFISFSENRLKTVQNAFKTAGSRFSPLKSPDCRSTYGVARLDGASNEYVYCINCDAEIYRQEALIVTSGEVFCDEGCADDMDFVNFHQSSTTRRLSIDRIRQDFSRAIPAFGSRAWFSNTNAALSSICAQIYKPTPFAEVEGGPSFCSTYETCSVQSELHHTVGMSARSGVGYQPFYIGQVFCTVEVDKKELETYKAMRVNVTPTLIEDITNEKITRASSDTPPIIIKIDSTVGRTNLATSFRTKPYEFVELSERLIEYDFDKEDSEIQRLFKENGFPSELIMEHSECQHTTTIY